MVSDYPELVYSQTAWIAANAERLNIKYVVNEGDITNDTANEHWKIADHAYRLLDGRVPYAMVMGNHDYAGGGTMESRSTERFDHYFPPSRIATQKGFLGSFDPESVVNAAYRFTANEQEWLIFALEFGPRDVVLAWVESVLAANPKAQAILVTHAYLFLDGTRFDRVNGKDQYNNPHDYEGEDGRLGGVNDAQEMWNKLIVKNPAIRFVLCGHMHGQARLESQRPGGPNVHEILSDYQSEDMGGGGYMRLMTFAPDGRVFVRSYSPYFDRYLTDADNEFVLRLDAQPKTGIASDPAQP